MKMYRVTVDGIDYNVCEECVNGTHMSYGQSHLNAGDCKNLSDDRQVQCQCYGYDHDELLKATQALRLSMINSRIEKLYAFRGKVRNMHDRTQELERAASLCDEAIWSSQCYLRDDQEHMEKVTTAAEQAIELCTGTAEARKVVVDLKIRRAERIGELVAQNVGLKKDDVTGWYDVGFGATASDLAIGRAVQNIIEQVMKEVTA